MCRKIFKKLESAEADYDSDDSQIRKGKKHCFEELQDFVVEFSQDQKEGGTLQKEWELVANLREDLGQPPSDKYFRALIN